VTGAASGIGAALTRALRAAGATVVPTDIAAGADRILDVRDAAAFTALVDSVAADHGRVDFLFNNAGIALGGNAADLTLEHWHRIVDVNIFGVVNGTRAVLPHLTRQGHGKIVNTASMAGLLPSPKLAAYGLTKHAVVGLSTALRLELGPAGVGVHVICPGLIETPLLDTSDPEDLPDSFRGFDVRAHLSALMGEPYPADRLAADVLAALSRDQPIIVTPRRAKAVWWFYRLSPTLLMKAEKLSSRRTRTS